MKLMKIKKLCGLCFLLVFAFSCNQEKMKDEKMSNYDQLQHDLLSTWNTWNNPSVLSHVKMPEGLNLQLIFRKKRGGPYWLKDAYIASPKHTFPEKILPGMHAYDGSYTDLELHWEGMKARVQSATDGDDVVLLFTPFENPERNHVLMLHTSILWNMPGKVYHEGEHIRADFGNTSYHVFHTGSLDSVDLPVDGPYFSFQSGEETGFCTGKQRTLEEIKAVIEDGRAKHMSEINKYGDLADAYDAMQSVMAWNVFYDAFNDRGIASVSRVWNEAWGGYIIFDWDTYFAALMASLDNKELAYSNAIAITRAITDNGFIPNVEASFGLKSNDRSQPPVGSMVCKMIHDKYQEDWFLEEVYDKLLSWNRWWDTARNNQGYLSWGSDPHPQGMDPHSAKAAKWESGLDNSPLFDEAVFNEEKDMFELASVGLMGLYVGDCRYLAEIAGVLGKQTDKDELLERAEKYSEKLEELWDEESGIYRDKNLVTGEFTSHLAPTNFYPLIGKVPDEKKARRMTEEHLMNPNEFYGEWMIPSIARNDPGYKDNSYWRGRIWAPMNFLVYMGLRNYDLPEARKLVAEKSLELLMKEWKENRRVYENYNSVTGVGGDVRNSDSFYSWGGLLGFIPLVEEGYFFTGE